jgi:hypothetical protein
MVHSCGTDLLTTPEVVVEIAPVEVEIPLVR